MIALDGVAEGVKLLVEHGRKSEGRFRSLGIDLDELLFHGGHLVIDLVRGRERGLHLVVAAEALVQRLHLRLEIADLVHGLVQLGNAFRHLGGEGKVLRQLGLRALGARIDDQMEGRGLTFPAGRQFDGVVAGEGEGTLGAVACIKRARHLDRFVVAQIPGETIHALIGRNYLRFHHPVGPFRRLFVFLFLLTGKMPNDFALRIQNVESDFVFGRTLEIVINHGAGWRILAHGLAAIEFLRVMQTQGGLRLIQNHLRGSGLRAGLANGGEVVQHPEGAAMRGHHEVIVLDHEVVDGRLGQIQL